VTTIATTGTPRRSEVIMAGSGGQGLLLSGILLAEAAIRDEKNVVQTVSYGIATRGGYSATEVIIDEGEIIFQQVQDADVVLAMTVEAMGRLESLAATGTLVVYDTTFVEECKKDNLCGYPFTETAGKLGHAGMANIIALGYLCEASSIVTAASLESAIAGRFSPDVRDANIDAMRIGQRAAAEIFGRAREGVR
jgi:2-oxoglutarate ferredoxin oxidoreductase subunit gamma